MTIGPPRSDQPYPFAKLDAAKAAAASKGIELIDFGVGDPQDATPLFIRQALADGITETSSYPRAAGTAQLRTAIQGWIQRRFGALVEEQQILPTLGSKEIIHSLAAYLLTDERKLVLVPSPAYPVYERGATFHGAEVQRIPLTAEAGFVPDLDAIDEGTWARTALLWLNYPNNPTGAVVPFEFYEKAAALARRHGFILASDEAYSEIWFDQKPTSVLSLDSLDNVVVINTLSKRSCMTGYRSGFIAGDAAVITRLRNYRPSVGVTPQEFVQHASVLAWSEEAHVETQRDRWLERRNLIAPIFEAAGLKVHSPATFFLWIETPEGVRCEAFAERLLDAGIVVSPGTFFGPEGEGFVRIALVPPVDQCIEAARRLETIL